MVGVGVHLPFVPQRAVCLPVLARLWRPRQPGRSKSDLACELVGLICARWPGRRIHLICDAAYAGKALAGLPAQVTVTTRLRCDAALYQLAPPRKPGQRADHGSRASGCRNRRRWPAWCTPRSRCLR